MEEPHNGGFGSLQCWGKGDPDADFSSGDARAGELACERVTTQKPPGMDLNEELEKRKE